MPTSSIPANSCRWTYNATLSIWESQGNCNPNFGCVDPSADGKIVGASGHTGVSDATIRESVSKYNTDHGTSLTVPPAAAGQWVDLPCQSLTTPVTSHS